MEGRHPTKNGGATLHCTNGGRSQSLSTPRRLAHRYSVVLVLLAAQNILAEPVQSRGVSSPVLQCFPWSTTSVVRCNSAQSSFLLAVLRGGSETEPEDAAQGEAVSNKDETAPAANSPTISKARSWLRVFQLRNEVQYDASRAPYVKKAANKNPTDSRGGAVVKQKPPRRSWMFANNNRAVTPAAAHVAKSVRKVWWVNTWTDQLPSEEEERKAVELQDQASVASNVTAIESSTSTIDDVEIEKGSDEPTKVEESKETTEQPASVTDTEKQKKPKHRRIGGRRNKSKEKQKKSPLRRAEEPVTTSVEEPTNEEAGSAVESVTEVTYPLMIPLPGLVGAQSKYCTSGPVSQRSRSSYLLKASLLTSIIIAVVGY